MRAVHEYRTADEIRNDPDIPNIVARAHTLEKFNQLHANDAPPVPIPDAGERRQLGELRGSLSSACAEWQALDEKEKKLSVWLPTATEKLRQLETETLPDAIYEAIDELNRLARRVQLARVSEQLFPTLHSHAGKFPGGVFNATDVTLANGSKIFGFATDEANKFEGWHNDHLLIIADEAKGIPDAIFEAIERCAPTRLLVMSSPGGCFGFFHAAFNSRRKYFRQHVVTAFDCPHISQTWIDSQIEKYGREHPLIQSMIFGEFMTGDADGCVIPLAFVERNLASPPAFVDGDAQAFCDFAAGGDENVLAVRRGNRVEIAASWREPDTMKACGKFIALFREQELTPAQISGDAGGLGLPMLDRLTESDWPIQGVNNGSPADKPEAYANKGAEIWFEARVKIEKGEVILPNDPELIAQLTSRRGWPDSRGRLQLESKADMRSRGLPSPDRADAVLGCMMPARGGGWDAQTLKDVFIGGGDSRLAFAPRHLENRFQPLLTSRASAESFEDMLRARGLECPRRIS